MSDWEQLVTEGHVRAARWRNAFPWLFAGAVAAVVCGIGMLLALPVRQPSTRVAEAKAAYAAEQRTAVARFLQDKGAIAGAPAQIEAVPAPDAAEARIAEVLAALNAGGKLPAHVVAQKPEAFWRGDWQADQLHAVTDGNTILTGAFVAAPPMVQRAYGLFRRNDAGAWRYYCLAVQGAQYCGQPDVEPAAIPATLRGLLPASAFEGLR